MSLETFQEREIESLTAVIAEQQERIDELENGYREAIEDIDSWAAYAAPYFREKHDLTTTLTNHRAILEG
jgi:uncharacterized coiled-coil protein SlyX